MKPRVAGVCSGDLFFPRFPRVFRVLSCDPNQARIRRRRRRRGKMLLLANPVSWDPAPDDAFRRMGLRLGGACGVPVPARGLETALTFPSQPPCGSCYTTSRPGPGPAVDGRRTTRPDMPCVHVTGTSWRARGLASASTPRSAAVPIPESHRRRTMSFVGWTVIMAWRAWPEPRRGTPARRRSPRASSRRAPDFSTFPFPRVSWLVLTVLTLCIMSAAVV